MTGSAELHHGSTPRARVGPGAGLAQGPWSAKPASGGRSATGPQQGSFFVTCCRTTPSSSVSPKWDGSRPVRFWLRRVRIGSHRTCHGAWEFRPRRPEDRSAGTEFRPARRRPRSAGTERGMARSEFRSARSQDRRGRARFGLVRRKFPTPSRQLGSAREQLPAALRQFGLACSERGSARRQLASSHRQLRRARSERSPARTEFGATRSGLGETGSEPAETRFELGETYPKSGKTHPGPSETLSGSGRAFGELARPRAASVGIQAAHGGARAAPRSTQDTLAFGCLALAPGRSRLPGRRASSTPPRGIHRPVGAGGAHPSPTARRYVCVSPTPSPRSRLSRRS
jgi:hypothetical protein